MQPRCFVIQPFDSGEYDKRFTEICKPALERAGLEAYRVDQDPSVDVPITAIEEGISEAAVCLADITTNNPNVWYELGFAYASNRPVILICSDKRKEKFPFDIQHRTIVQYGSESKSDFQTLEQQIYDRAKALLTRSLLMERAADADESSIAQGLSQQELIVLAVLAGETAIPDSTTPVFSLQHGVERAGLTTVAFGVAIRQLLRKKFVSTQTESDSNSFDDYLTVQITARGWQAIEANQQGFVVHKIESQSLSVSDDDIPF